MANCNNVIFTSVSYRRNIKDMPFVSKLTDTELAFGVCKTLNEIYGDEFEFKSLKNISLKNCLKLMEEGIISKELIENKDISAYGTSPNAIIFANEEDHIKLTAKAQGFNLENCFNLANVLDDKLLEKLEICFDNNLGYLTANPNLVGTAMEICVMLFIPALASSKKIDKIVGELNGLYTFCQIDGSVYNPNSPFVVIKNKYTFGHKENEIAQNMQNVIAKIIASEEKEEASIFDLSPATLVDNIFRAYGTLTNCYRITQQECICLFGSVLWGINLKILKPKKKFDVINTIAKICDNHLVPENVSVKEQEKIRAKTISAIVLELAIKGEVDV